MKYILIIGDGMADDPVPELGNKTPLGCTQMINTDALASKSLIANALTVPAGVPAGSDTAILSILGCDPRAYYTGRAPLEAAGCGYLLKAGDSAYRCNMVTLEDGGTPYAEKKILSHSAGGVDGDESIALINYLFGHPDFKAAAERAGLSVVPNPSFRHIAVQANTDTMGIILTPPHDILGSVIGGYLPKGTDNADTLKQLMILSNKLLDGHEINKDRRSRGLLPANGIWFWAEGTAVKLPSFPEKYKKTGAAISAVPLVQGIARLTGLASVDVPGATGELDTNYEGKVEYAINELSGGCDFVVIHVEAPDECTHNGDLPGKLKALEYLDARVIAPVVSKMDALGLDYRLLFISDHRTLTSTRGHDGGPVPFMLYDSTRPLGSGPRYDESCGAAGAQFEGVKLMDMLFCKEDI